MTKLIILIGALLTISCASVDDEGNEPGIASVEQAIGGSETNIVLNPGGGQCGKNVCSPGFFCCNPSCGICAPRGGACTDVFCENPQAD